MVPVNSVQMKSPLRSVDQQQHTGMTGRSSLTTSPVVIRTQTGSLTANPVVSVCCTLCSLSNLDFKAKEIFREFLWHL